MNSRIVDYSALRTNQAFIIGSLLAAFVLNLAWLVALVSAVMLVGTLLPDASLFKAIYFYVLKPLSLVRRDPRPDNPEPHLFAQGVGGAFLLAATVAFALQWALVGWTLTWVVIGLASLNLFAGVCVGCMMYDWFKRLGVPGFTRAPVHKSSKS